jgi:hypothetical protein
MIQLAGRGLISGGRYRRRPDLAAVLAAGAVTVLVAGCGGSSALDAPPPDSKASISQVAHQICQAGRGFVLVSGPVREQSARLASALATQGLHNKDATVARLAKALQALVVTGGRDGSQARIDFDRQCQGH